MKWRGLLDFRGIFGNVNTRTIYLYSIVIGLLSGLIAVLFDFMLEGASYLTMNLWAQFSVPQPAGDPITWPTPEGPPNRLLLA